LRWINVFAAAVLADLHEQLEAFYSDIGRPSVDPELSPIQAEKSRPDYPRSWRSST
jgi:hypothetical protein